MTSRIDDVDGTRERPTLVPDRALRHTPAVTSAPAADDEIVIACCQLAPVLGDVAANTERTVAAIRAAAGEGARLIVLPELASSGYMLADREEAQAAAQSQDGPTLQAWAHQARDLDVVIVGGFCELDADGQLRNSAAIIDASGLRAVYRKAHLWDRERLLFIPGDDAPPVVQTPIGRVGVLVCYDLEFPEWVRIPALAGAQVLAVPTNWPRGRWPEGERAGEVLRAMSDAAVNRIFIAVADRVGEERGQAWVGGSAVIDPDGWPLAGGGDSASEATVMAACRLGEADEKSYGGLSDAFADRRPELYSRHLR